MSQWASLPDRREIAATARRSLRRSPSGKGGRKLWRVALSIASAGLNVRFSIERSKTGKYHAPRQLPADSASGQQSGNTDAPSQSQSMQTGFASPGLDGAQAGYSGKRAHSTSRRDNSDAIDFWAALDADEREAFITLADERTFAAGAKLMQEGEQANHVAVIYDGRVRILVRENERTRILAERGPGELIGERAALRISVRSATVIALERVHALVVSTEDFAAFVSDHPGVLEILEGQIYDRLTERTPDGELGATRPLSGQYCTIIYTDVVGFAGDMRNDLDRLVVRQVTGDITRAALDPFRHSCTFGDRGDGLLIVVTPNIPTTVVLERLLTVLPTELERHNRGGRTAVRVQLRAAISVGPVVQDGTGVNGEAIIFAARMLEEEAFKSAIADSHSVLGLITSDFVYETAIKHAEYPVDRANYVPVRVQVKESRMSAWMQMVNPH